MTLQPIPGAGPDPRDQPQRSVLAWRRTSLAILAVGLVLGRAALVTAHPSASAVTVLALACALALLVSSQRRLGDTQAALGRPPSAFAPLLLAGVATTAMAVATLLLVLVP